MNRKAQRGPAEGRWSVPLVEGRAAAGSAVRHAHGQQIDEGRVSISQDAFERRGGLRRREGKVLARPGGGREHATFLLHSAGELYAEGCSSQAGGDLRAGQQTFFHSGKGANQASSAPRHNSTFRNGIKELW